MKRVLALDLDGTLINKYGEISEMNRRAVQYATKRGYEVVISTGRTKGHIDIELMKSIGIRYLICMNGAMIYDMVEDNSIYENTMDIDLALELFEQLPQKDIFRTIYGEKMLYVPSGDEKTIHLLGYSEANNIEFLKNCLILDHIEEEVRTKDVIFKITADCVPNENKTANVQLLNQLAQKYPMFNCVSGGFNSTEFFNKDVGKGKALQILSEKNGYDLNHSFAIGDSENDLEMIETVGFGISVANGEEKLKKAAKFVTRDCEEDGVATAIYYLI